VTAVPGGQTATGVGSPLTVTGLINGTAYTFSVQATNAAGGDTAAVAVVLLGLAAAGRLRALPLSALTPIQRAVDW